MRYKNRTRVCHFQASWTLSSPSLAEGFVQIVLDGVQEVCGVDVMLVQFAAEKTRQDKGYQNTETSVPVFKKHSTIQWFIVL